jgi:hypothetical protein
VNTLIGNSKKIKITTLATVLLFQSACTTTFGEEHYFQTKNSKTGEVSNYMRLKVEGYAFMSSARYVAGYYDERAVDLFFNELKVTSTENTATSTNGFMEGDLNNPGTQDKILPLSPTNENGAFVMVLSSNASSVTNVIGQFAENQVVADAVTNLVNKDLIIAEEYLGKAEVLSINASADELNKLFSLVPTSTTPNKAETIKAYLRILNAVARSVSPDIDSFKTLNEAEVWIKEQKKESRQ